MARCVRLKSDNKNHIGSKSVHDAKQIQTATLSATERLTCRREQDIDWPHRKSESCKHKQAKLADYCSQLHCKLTLSWAFDCKGKQRVRSHFDAYPTCCHCEHTKDEQTATQTSSRWRLERCFQGQRRQLHDRASPFSIAAALALSLQMRRTPV